MTAMSQVEVLRAACCVAGADQEINDKELTVLRQLAAKAGVGRASLEAMIELSTTDPNFYKQQFRVLKQDPDETLRLLYAVAAIDGEVGPNESAMLKAFGQALEVPEEKVAEIEQATSSAMRNHPRENQ